MTDKPKALWLADMLLDPSKVTANMEEAAAELRRLHEVNKRLEVALNDALSALFECETDEEVAKFRRAYEVNQALVDALEVLAKLGNGNEYGNSEGNQIAQAALAKAKEST